MSDTIITWSIRTRQPKAHHPGGQLAGLWCLRDGGRIETGLALPHQALQAFFAQEVEPVDGMEYMVTPDKYAYAAVIRVRTGPILEFVT